MGLLVVSIPSWRLLQHVDGAATPPQPKDSAGGADTCLLLPRLPLPKRHSRARCLRGEGDERARKRKEEKVVGMYVSGMETPRPVIGLGWSHTGHYMAILFLPEAFPLPPPSTLPPPPPSCWHARKGVAGA